MLKQITGRCKFCNAPIRWARHKTTDKPNPLNPQPVLDGNILLDPQRNVYEQLTGDDLSLAREKRINLFLSHAATCQRQPQRGSGRTSYPEEMLASCSSRSEAEDLKRDISQRFHRPLYVVNKPEYTLPFLVMIDEDLSAPARAEIRQFVVEWKKVQEERGVAAI
jgi:hypothetical protein